MVHHPETFPEELKLLLSFLHGYLETMFALQILGNAERLLFILCRGTFRDLQTLTSNFEYTMFNPLATKQNPGSLK